jgi:hypothetical protein
MDSFLHPAVQLAGAGHTSYGPMILADSAAWGQTERQPLVVSRLPPASPFTPLLTSCCIIIQRERKGESRQPAWEMGLLAGRCGLP